MFFNFKIHKTFSQTISDKDCQYNKLDISTSLFCVAKIAHLYQAMSFYILNIILYMLFFQIRCERKRKKLTTSKTEGYNIE